jgi:hypothetical protein
MAKQVQGDQIAPNFVTWVIVYNGQFFNIKEVTHILGYFFPRLMLSIEFDQKMSWATFWATVS